MQGQRQLHSDNIMVLYLCVLRLFGVRVYRSHDSDGSREYPVRFGSRSRGATDLSSHLVLESPGLNSICRSSAFLQPMKSRLKPFFFFFGFGVRMFVLLGVGPGSAYIVSDRYSSAGSRVRVPEAGLLLPVLPGTAVQGRGRHDRHQGRGPWNPGGIEGRNSSGEYPPPALQGLNLNVSTLDSLCSV